MSTRIGKLWEVTATAAGYSWDQSWHVIAPTLENALAVVRPLFHEWQNMPKQEHRKDFVITSCQYRLTVDAAWSLPIVTPKRPTVDQLASAEVEALLEDV